MDFFKFFRLIFFLFSQHSRYFSNFVYQNCCEIDFFSLNPYELGKNSIKSQKEEKIIQFESDNFCLKNRCFSKVFQTSMEILNFDRKMVSIFIQCRRSWIANCLTFAEHDTNSVESSLSYSTPKTVFMASYEIVDHINHYATFMSDSIVNLLTLRYLLN